jgi:hypothetical protein
MASTDPVTDLAGYIGDIVYTALESARLGYLTDTDTATQIATDNIMAGVYAARPALVPQQGPGYPPPPVEPARRGRHGWRQER